MLLRKDPRQSGLPLKRLRCPRKDAKYCGSQIRQRIWGDADERHLASIIHAAREAIFSSAPQGRPIE